MCLIDLSTSNRGRGETLRSLSSHRAIDLSLNNLRLFSHLAFEWISVMLLPSCPTQEDIPITGTGKLLVQSTNIDTILRDDEDRRIPRVIPWSDNLIKLTMNTSTVMTSRAITTATITNSNGYNDTVMRTQVRALRGIMASPWAAERAANHALLPLKPLHRRSHTHSKHQGSARPWRRTGCRIKTN
ncbi:hypothetical protein J6590_085480 [Homalodisca vitripennis]|nr:hypothetical protein J6590_085480 [Homalodisca vitripennis]